MSVATEGYNHPFHQIKVEVSSEVWIYWPLVTSVRPGKLSSASAAGVSPFGCASRDSASVHEVCVSITGASSWIGVDGAASSWIGVDGAASSWIGVDGAASSWIGVDGAASSRVGVAGCSSSCVGVGGGSSSCVGVAKPPSSSVGVAGGCSSRVGVAGGCSSRVGVAGGSSSCVGVGGDSSSCIGVPGSSSSLTGAALPYKEKRFPICMSMAYFHSKQCANQYVDKQSAMTIKGKEFS